MKRANLLTAGMVMVTILLTGGLTVASAQNMGDDHQGQDQMTGDQHGQQMHENMQNMQNMQNTDMLNMNGQGMMMSMDEMMDQMGQLMTHSDAMLTAMESSSPGGLMGMFRGNGVDNHMLDMTQDMSEMMGNMQGLMENMQTIMGNQTMMSQPGMQTEMERMQETLGGMTGSMQEMMDNMHNIQKINPKLKTKN
ncbi:MAG: DUF4175 domain-containing protein [Candidatus Marinimicrobia bacterium]|nr:DUF4175 domain-containing protein [Candidatus Neomarinimicrobiota bacterium]